MSRPHFISLAIWAAFAAIGVGAYLLVPMFWAGAAIAVLCFLAGSLLSAMMFNRLATPEERRLDLEDRVRNQD